MTAFAIPPFFLKYTADWILFCLAAVVILMRDRRQVAAEWRDYLPFLFVPWKWCVFIPAALFVTFAGRYTNDETWDVITGSGMSVLTFFTAPWAIGLFFQVAAGRRALRYMIVVIALTLFSSSWFYDGYLLWRDGSYTHRWLGNLMLSPIIYMTAGLFWNLESTGNGDFFARSSFRFAFVRHDWPSRPDDTRFAPIALVSMPLVLLAAYVLVGFVGWNFQPPHH
ncbi:MAG TPA: hypothetical protein VIF60_25170 [Burkholderiaceae bacterium]